jgi:hypothetical protein
VYPPEVPDQPPEVPWSFLLHELLPDAGVFFQFDPGLSFVLKQFNQLSKFSVYGNAA